MSEIRIRYQRSKPQRTAPGLKAFRIDAEMILCGILAFVVVFFAVAIGTL